MIKTAFLYSLGVVIYIILVATIMTNGEKLFGQVDRTIIGPIAILLLFSLSALVVGALVLGKPLMLYLDGAKKEAVKLLTATAAWLFGFTVLALLIAYLLR